MRRLEIGNVGRKWWIQFWKAQEGDNLLAVLHYATSHKASSIKKEGKRESKLQIQGCSFVSFCDGRGCCLFQRKMGLSGFSLHPSYSLAGRGTTGKWRHRGAVGKNVGQGLRSQGCRRIWLPSLVQGMQKCMEQTGEDGGWDVSHLASRSRWGCG